jgi:hypothetical protein
MVKRVTPILAEGHELPKVPVYWLIWVLEEESRRPYASWSTYHKYLTPAEASQECIGIEPTKNMVFFNMGPRVAEMSKRMNPIRKLWIEKRGR